MSFGHRSCVGLRSAHAVPGLTGRGLAASRPTQLRWAGLAAGLVVLLWAAGVEAAPIGTDWTAVSPTTADGNLDGISVSVTGLSRGPFGSDVLIVDDNLSGPDYAAAPLGPTEVIVYWAALSDWTATFGEAIPDLRLYLRFWRGQIGVNVLDVFSYTFDQPFAVLSGLEDALVVGNTIALADTPTLFHDGIIEFTGPVSSLSVSVTAPATPNSSDQRLTFGIDSTPVPEPSVMALTLLSLAALRQRGRRGRILASRADCWPGRTLS